MSDIPSDPARPGPVPFPEVDPAGAPEEAPPPTPAPQEDDTGRPHDASS